MSKLSEVKIPHSGSVETVEINEWLVRPGDSVAEGDFLAEVSTDKADTELESPSAGVVARILFEAGSEVPVGTIVALLAAPGTVAEELAAAISEYESQ